MVFKGWSNKSDPYSCNQCRERGIAAKSRRGRGRGVAAKIRERLALLLSGEARRISAGVGLSFSCTPIPRRACQLRMSVHLGFWPGQLGGRGSALSLLPFFKLGAPYLFRLPPVPSCSFSFSLFRVCRVSADPHCVKRNSRSLPSSPTIDGVFPKRLSPFRCSF